MLDHSESPTTALRRLHALQTGLIAQLDGAYSKSEMARCSTGSVPGLKDILLYLLVRKLKPGLVIETGVAQGVSSTFILTAMKANGRGSLISIDLPNFDPSGYVYPGAAHIRDPVYVKESLGPGWIVPDEIRSRWQLLLGDAREVLPRLSEPVDLFFHDSLHEYQHMMFEFRWAFKNLRTGGLLASDDIAWNASFNDFILAHRTELRVLSQKRVGLLQKLS